MKFYKDRKTREGYTDENASIILKSESTHNHAQDENLERQIISNSSKRKAEVNIFEMLSKIMKGIISNSLHS